MILNAGTCIDYACQLLSVSKIYFSTISYIDIYNLITTKVSLTTSIFQFVSPALRKMLENLSSKLLDNFKTTLERSLAQGKGFEASAGSCSESCMAEFLKGCEGNIHR